MNDEITGEALAPIFDYVEEELGNTSLKQLIELAGIRDFFADDQRYRMLASGDVNAIIKACRKKSNWFSVEFVNYLFRSAAELIRQAGQDKDDYTVVFEIGYKSCKRDIRKIGILRDTRSEDPGGFYEKTPRYVNVLNKVWNIESRNRVHSIELLNFLELTLKYISSKQAKDAWDEANARFNHFLQKNEFRLDYIQLRWVKYNLNAIFDLNNLKYTEGIFSGVPHVIGLPDPIMIELEKYSEASPYAYFGILYVCRNPSFEKGYNVKKTIKNISLDILGNVYNLFTEKKALKTELIQKETIINNLYGSLRETVDKLLTQLTDAQEARRDLEQKVTERTKELRETQAKLVEAEKRSLEHRIAGGFAHEMRNALSGAQLEFKTTLNYKDKGKPSAEILKNSTTSLLKNISLIHEKYGIPREEIASHLIPELKNIAEIADHLSGTISGVAKDLDRGLSITSQIRDYAKMSELKRGHDRIDLMAFLRGYQDRYIRDFESHNISYTVQGPDEVIVNADEIHMNSIFTNLINNARDALIEHGAESKEIKVIVEEVDEEGKKYVRIKLHDNGPGIPENNLNEIFEPFFSTKPTSGTGLGLGIVKRLIQLYDWRIEAESKENEGTCFTVLLPTQENT